ncbi:hypothetical protein VN97_g9528 [Penicillium thymicola]|uniref:Uncharacterized protein n=1 Tax=Penicillium thymicola TaxID=293382 RepID=A0AAI9TBC5_PENTH|nr:hypothetical protein VN97_g9528 [Penicillium thymicola]
MYNIRSRPVRPNSGLCSSHVNNYSQIHDANVGTIFIPDGTIAQLGERATEVRKVAGSIPARPIIFLLLNCLVKLVLGNEYHEVRR